MIRVTLELVSAVDPSRDRLLGIAYIANMGMGQDGKADYRVDLSKNLPGRTGESWKRGRAAVADEDLTPAVSGEVVAFDNVKRGAWDLLYLALKAVVGSRN